MSSSTASSAIFSSALAVAAGARGAQQQQQQQQPPPPPPPPQLPTASPRRAELTQRVLRAIEQLSGIEQEFVSVDDLCVSTDLSKLQVQIALQQLTSDDAIMTSRDGLSAALSYTSIVRLRAHSRAVPMQDDDANSTAATSRTSTSRSTSTTAQSAVSSAATTSATIASTAAVLAGHAAAAFAPSDEERAAALAALPDLVAPFQANAQPCTECGAEGEMVVYRASKTAALQGGYLNANFLRPYVACQQRESGCGHFSFLIDEDAWKAQLAEPQFARLHAVARELHLSEKQRVAVDARRAELALDVDDDDVDSFGGGGGGGSSSALVRTAVRRAVSDERKRKRATEGDNGGIERKRQQQRENVFRRKNLSLEQKRVLDLVLGGHSVFFTGAAGTGKSTLLKTMINELRKRATTKEEVAVTASTGIAAVAIGGSTLHSFAGCGLAEYPKEKLAGIVRHNKNAQLRWENCEILIIDEVSMLSGEFFDKIEFVARNVRKEHYRHVPFGGIQVVATGDFHQLPPVVKGGGNNAKPYCFLSDAWKRTIKKQVIMRHVFRQQGDPRFLKLLTSARHGEMTQEDLMLLRGCVNKKLDNPTRLYARIYAVDAENKRRLDALPGTPHIFKATDTGKDRSMVNNMEKFVSAPTALVLKEGAFVMLTKNMDMEKGLCNGTQGTVMRFVRDQVGAVWPHVRFRNGEERTLQNEEWTMEKGGEVVARRAQIPLMLAWALSIHKSQGMTLEEVQVQLNNIFEVGQAYVALSRATSLQGLSILGNVDPYRIRADPHVAHFYKQLAPVVSDKELEELCREQRRLSSSSSSSSCNPSTSSSSSSFSLPQQHKAKNNGNLESNGENDNSIKSSANTTNGSSNSSNSMSSVLRTSLNINNDNNDDSIDYDDLHNGTHCAALEGNIDEAAAEAAAEFDWGVRNAAPARATFAAPDFSSFADDFDDDMMARALRSVKWRKH